MSVVSLNGPMAQVLPMQSPTEVDVALYSYVYTDPVATLGLGYETDEAWAST